MHSFILIIDSWHSLYIIGGLFLVKKMKGAVTEKAKFLRGCYLARWASSTRRH
ncbi:MAG: hypothetical protein Hyperionvirus11_34 [Hyperionvirus sp.]|uniref:Uncharacterized protein n=1 Tax=Hyperionvirus sp. TaxID=2487770 RepID=A0A3G5ABS6_9VIRU|nr:MAG: hypothetical protein Hyperionvirus11_34 [Hyperionvirus sp.]